jgi:hypothetical protein
MTVVLSIVDGRALLCRVKDDTLGIDDLEFHLSPPSRNSYGFEYPKHIQGATSGGVRIEIRTGANIDAGFFNLKMFCEVEITEPGGSMRVGRGVIEFSQHDRANRRLLQKLSNLRVGRNGRSPIF